MPRIDSHHHFWNYSAAEYPWIGPEKRILQRDFGAGDLEPELEAANIDGVVSVQARQTVEETRCLLQIAAEREFVKGVVGWVPCAEPRIEEILGPMASSPWLKGVRHVVQDEPDDEFLLRAEFNHGVGALRAFDLVYDILIYARQLPAATEFVDRHPHQRFVLDHIAKPVIAGDELDPCWEDRFRELARRDNVTCKFSGVVTEVRDAEWSLEMLRPYWDTAWEAFGADRMMFGSDWPVCLLRTGYQQWVASVAQLSAELTPDEQSRFWGDNAIRVYTLEM